MAAVKLIGMAVLACASALAGEFAILSNGFRIPAERHETAGDIVKLYSKDGGVTQLPSAQVAAFEPDDGVKPAPEPLPVPEAPARPSAADIDLAIERAAARWGLPSKLVRSVALAESAYRHDAVSSKGAIGVMQLMPDTAKLLGADPHDYEQNIDAGARYLRELLLKYDKSMNKALAAYNAGPGAVDRYKGIPPYRETVKYIERIVRDYLRDRDGIR